MKTKLWLPLHATCYTQLWLQAREEEEEQEEEEEEEEGRRSLTLTHCLTFFPHSFIAFLSAIFKVATSLSVFDLAVHSSPPAVREEERGSQS